MRDRQRRHHVARGIGAGAIHPARAANAFDAPAGTVHAQQAVAGGADPHPAVGVFGDGAHLGPAQALGHAIAREAAAGQVGAADAAVLGAGPQGAGPVDQHGADLVVGQRVLVRGVVAVGEEAAAGRVQPLQALHVGADPQGGAAVVVERQDAHLADALGRPQAAALGRALAEAPGFEPGAGADPQRVARPHRQRQHGVALRVLRVDRMVFEAVRARGQPVQAGRGADPEIPLAVERQGVDAVVAQRRGVERIVAEGAHPSAGGVGVQQAVAGRQPESTVARGHDGEHAAVAGAPAGLVRRRVAQEAAGGAVEARQAALGAEPQAALGVLVGRHDVVVGDAVGIAGLVAVARDAVAVVAVQPGLGAEPHEAAPVLQDRQHGLLRQALLHREALEAQGARRGAGGAGPGRQQQRQQQ